MAEATAVVFNNRLPAEQEGQLTPEQTMHVLNQFRQHDFDTYLDLVGKKINPPQHKPIGIRTTIINLINGKRDKYRS